MRTSRKETKTEEPIVQVGGIKGATAPFLCYIRFENSRPIS